jgi:hypothetical protein
MKISSVIVFSFDFLFLFLSSLMVWEELGVDECHPRHPEAP